MAFDQASDFIFAAAQKYNLHRQVLGGMMCERFRQFVAMHHPEFAAFWEPTKFEHGILSVKPANSSASNALFMRTHDLTERLNAQDLPHRIKEIRIAK